MIRLSGTFRPPWWASLGTVLLGALFVSAGFWQLSRAGEKRALFADFDARAAATPMPAPDPSDYSDRLRYQPVSAQGRYDAEHQILLDARTRDGRAGYEILTPLLSDGAAILVNRGWVAANPDRQRLPTISVDPAPRRVLGRLDQLPRAALTTAPAVAPAAGDTWPRVLLFPTAGQLSAALGYPVTGYQLLLDAGEPEGYRRDWRPALMTPVQHVGYAVQWFALATALVVLYVVLNLRKSGQGQATS